MFRVAPSLLEPHLAARASLNRRALRTSVTLAALLLAAGCASPAGTGGVTVPQGSAGATDVPCKPLSQHQGCNGIDRMLCEHSSSSWQILEECGVGEACVEKDDPGLPGALLASCKVIPTPAADGGSTDGTIGGGSSGGGSSGGGVPGDVCDRWNADRKDLAEGDWDGSAPKCDPGTLTGGAIERATKVVNLYRAMAGLPEVDHDPDLDKRAQACALIMRANGSITHTPAKSAKCYTDMGATAAKKSNLSTAGAVVSVDRYMVDSGSHNQATLGHRRWILNNKLDFIGVGSTGAKFSCLHVIGGKGNAKKPWVAFPSPGKVPFGVISPYGTSIDTTGWSIQSDTVSFSQAEVHVTVGGEARKVSQRLLKGGYGSKYAIAWRPDGWKTEAGVVYHVELTKVSTPISYDVDVVDCGQ